MAMVCDKWYSVFPGSDSGIYFSKWDYRSSLCNAGLFFSTLFGKAELLFLVFAVILCQGDSYSTCYYSGKYEKRNLYCDIQCIVLEIVFYLFPLKSLNCLHFLSYFFSV